MRDFNKSRGFGQGRGGFGRDSGRPALFKATCTDCGNTCEVPFKPMHGKPVYCNNCFKRDGDFDSNRGGGRDSGQFERRDSGRPNFRDRDRGDRQMHEATCAECGERCEVPFRPTGEKPVYCRDCFGSSKGESSGPSFKKPEPSNGQFDQLNTKLDKILKELEILRQKKEFIVEKPEAKPEVKAVDKKVPVKKVSKTSKPKKKAKG